MKKNKFVFVVLNYITENDTEECVESIIKNCKEANFEIVIVDNGSPNNSGERLKNKYNDNKLVHVIISDTNLGFAKGHNLGFKYAKDNLKPNFIILCNNDIKIIQDDFCSKIENKYIETNFAVLGPKELQLDNTYYPVNLYIPTIEQVKKNIFKFRIQYYSRLGSLLLKKRKQRYSETGRVDPNKEYTNIILHGECLVFSNIYIEKFDGLDSRTFLYEEESLLYIRLMKNNMINIYDPNVEILHKRNSSTNAVNKTNRKKEKFIAKHEIKSLKILLKEMTENKEIISKKTK